jgi:glycosyltransferase involved in cell wall biosynthesis
VAAARRAIPRLGPRWIAYNGAVEPRKNMERLIEAYAQLPAAVREDWQLVLVCALDPLQRNHYEVRARQLGIADRLLLAGFLSDEHLALVYQGADLVAFPSLYEGYGLPVAEALACGAPVVASGTSALGELVAPGATFDPGDTADISRALAQALVDEAHHGHLMAWAARRPPSWADVADRVATVYRDLLARPGSCGAPPTTGTANPAGAGFRAGRGAGWRRRPRLAMSARWPGGPTSTCS